MKYECGIIEDLLPLYKDNACSVASFHIVQEHLEECPKCKKLLEELNDTSLEEMILKEKENVIGTQAKYFKRKSAVAGSVIAGIFALPILICLIANLASGHGLSWFFIVLAAMLIPTSLFVVPLMAPKNRMFLTMTSFTGSLILLLAVCAIYTRGNWFLTAASSVLFGLTLCFAPFIVCRRPVNAYLKNYKGLTAMGANTLTFFLMLICIGLQVRTPGYFRMAFSISIPLVLLVWILFAVIRYLPANGLVKTGTCITVLSLFSYFGTKLILALTLTRSPYGVTVYTEPNILPMLVGVLIGVIFVACGLIGGKKNEK